MVQGQVALQIIIHTVGAVAVIWAIGNKNWKPLIAGSSLMVISSIMMQFDNSFSLREVPGLYGPGILILTVPAAISLGLLMNRYTGKFEPETEALSAEEIDDRFE